MPTETSTVTLNQPPEVLEILKAMAENTRQPDPALPDEQVWLRIFCAAITSGAIVENAALRTDNGLKAFRLRFR